MDQMHPIISQDVVDHAFCVRKLLSKYDKKLEVLTRSTFGLGLNELDKAFDQLHDFTSEHATIRRDIIAALDGFDDAARANIHMPPARGRWSRKRDARRGE